MKFKSDTDVEFDNELLWCTDINRRIKNKGLDKKLQAFVATFPAGQQEYVLFLDGKPYKFSQSFETICTYVDMYALSENLL